MCKLLTHLIVCCVLTSLFSTAAIAIPVDDFDDADHAGDGVWFDAHGGTLTTVAYLDSANKYQQFFVWEIYVDNALDYDHCHDKDGTEVPHVHFSADYGIHLAGGNRYWDHMFQAPDICERESGSNATVRSNCFSYALTDFIGLGVYNQTLRSSDAINALAIDANPHDKSTVQSCDVIQYGTYHFTGVHDIDSVANKPDYFGMEEWFQRHLYSC